jgi:hypothetical protein
VQLVEWKGRVFIDHVWDDFVYTNGIAEGNTLIFAQYAGSPMKVTTFDNSSS